MKKLIYTLILVCIVLTSCDAKKSSKAIASAGNELNITNAEPDTLRIFTGLTYQLLSMSHGIDGFFIPNTTNTLPNSDNNINNIKYEGLDGLLSLTALAYIDGRPAGIANETELIYDFSKKSDANTMWLLRMNAKGHNGFITVEQIENPANADANIMKELEEAQSKQEKIDKDFWLRTTSKEGATVKHASGDFEKYNGGTFTEYTVVNLADSRKNGIMLEFITKTKSNK